MNWLINFLIAIAMSYAAIGVLGFVFKLWYLLFMFGWNLI